MGSIKITFLVLVGLVLSLPFIACEHEIYIWRTKGGIIKVEPVCGESTAQVSEINLYADYPVVVEIFCKDGVTATPASLDGVKYTQLVGFTASQGQECIFEKMENSEVYTLKVQVGWEWEGAAVDQARELFLIDCSYSTKSNAGTNEEYIETDKFTYDEIIHNMGPPNLSDVSLKVVNIRGWPLGHMEVPIGRVIKLHAVVSGPTRLRPVNCIATNGVKMHRLLLGGCGDGLVFSKSAGFIVTDDQIVSPFFVAFRLQGSNTMIFKCNFTVCIDSSSCDGSTCYKNFVGKRSVLSRRSVSELDSAEPYSQDQEPAGLIATTTSSISNTNRRSRRSVCRLDPSDPDTFTSRRPRCIDGTDFNKP